jgi:sRNA-binding carbon storage regulator CsrA
MIGSTVVNVREIGNGRVRLAIDAPTDVPVTNESAPSAHRKEGIDKPSSR